MTLRLPDNTVVRLSPVDMHIVTRDGWPLSTASIRPGDTIVLRAGGRIEDTSQAVTSVDGIVASPPDLDVDTMIVQLGRSRQIVVTMSPQTRINGALATPESRGLIMVAERVRLRGVFDQQFGEMTNTNSVRLLR
jgi:hypothetical protein